ncbi:MAG: dipeptidase, partial [Bifidobacterium castoris]|nr:dipeptidase [Bifidobacterium castoris]
DAQHAQTLSAVENYQQRVGALGHAMPRAAAEQVNRLGGDAVLEAAAREHEYDDGFAEDDLVEDVQPMEPDGIIEAVRDTEVRGVLATANEDLARQLKRETEKLLDTALYTSSLAMKNHFAMSDN